MASLVRLFNWHKLPTKTELDGELSVIPVELAQYYLPDCNPLGNAAYLIRLCCHAAKCGWPFRDILLWPVQGRYS